MSKSIDIVLPLGPSKIDHIDLRYALRSIEKHVKNYRDIWIIGDLPRWIQNVKHLGVSDDPDPRWKEFNIFRKIKSCCINRDITEDFLFANDDHFFLDDIDASSYPYYYKGTVTDSWINNRSHYRKTANHTRRWLERRGFKDHNFDSHCPIIYNKHKFLTSYDDIDWQTAYGYLIKTHYCAVNRVKGVYMQDCKLSKKFTLEEVRERAEDRHVISCTDAAMKAGLRDFLEEKFPTKSKYEI